MATDTTMARTKAFYDGYWPRNVPDYEKTREHVRDIVPNEGSGG
jgi:hypothetical protein